MVMHSQRVAAARAAASARRAHRAMQQLAVFVFVCGSAALDNGVGLTPPMGYNTWDDFRCDNINSSNIMRVADAVVSSGLREYGYEYINIDDCWATGRNKSSGVIIADPSAFPEGMKAVADYVHSKGLKFGIYTDRGTSTCVGRPGSQGFEKIDAETYASWGCDYVKEDSCAASSDHDTAFQQYGLMRDALNATGRHIFFALCGWSNWYAPEGKNLGNSWRYGYDVNDWQSAWGNSINGATDVAKFAGPGAWNDPDALIGTSPSAAVHMTETQSRTQFSLWAMMAAPLIIGSNILNLPPYDFETYTNTEAIAVNQDPLGIQGTVVYQSCPRSAELISPIQASVTRRDRRGLQSFAVPDCTQIWTRKLRDGYALAFVNYTKSSRVPVDMPLSDGRVLLSACNATEPSQLWNVTTSGDDSMIAAYSGENACWEVRGCNYQDGATVDASFGCKAFPSARDRKPCDNNMAWSINSNGTITSQFSGECFEANELDGGYLAHCVGSKAQQWRLEGKRGMQKIVSAEGKCITRGAPPQPPQPPQPAGELTFDIATFGWDSAHVRDLWAHADLGVMANITVRLHGDGDSKLFKLTKATKFVFV